MSDTPTRFELTWKGGEYRVSIPNHLTEGERVRVREEAISDDDVRVAMDWLNGLCSAALEESEPFNDRSVEDDARAFLAAVFEREQS